MEFPKHNKVFASVKMFQCHSQDIIIARRDGNELGHPQTALFLKDRKEVPFPTCIPSGYISGFPDIDINFLDEQVLDFVKLLCDRIKTQGRIRIDFLRPPNVLNDRQQKQAFMDQLFTIFRNASTNHLKLLCSFQNIWQNVKDMDTGMEAIYLTHIGEWDIPMLMQMLATRRADGQQRVIQLENFGDANLAENIVASIKREFRASIQPLPQPFLFRFYRSNLAFMPFEEKNQQTEEILFTINSDENIFDRKVLEFLKFTAPRIIQNRVWIMLDLVKPLEEEQCLAVDQLLNIYRDISANIYLDVLSHVSSLRHTLPYQLGNKMELIELNIKNKSNIQTVVKMLAMPRTDGRQHVAYLNFHKLGLCQQMLAIVKKEFFASNQPLPQPFYIRCWDIMQHNVHIEEENHHREQTGEEVIIRTIINRHGENAWDICRHPAGKHEEWAEDGRKRLEWEEDKEKDCTWMQVAIFDFGATHSSIA